jgi:hypothetical protein
MVCTGTVYASQFSIVSLVALSAIHKWVVLASQASMVKSQVANSCIQRWSVPVYASQASMVSRVRDKRSKGSTIDWLETLNR